MNDEYSNTQIKTTGYLQINKAFSPSSASVFFKDATCDYTNMKAFINNTILPGLTTYMSWKDPSYVAFRASDNNNVDSSLSHRDIICQIPKPTADDVIPSFTCLCYLDATSLEVIPGSHIELGYNGGTVTGQATVINVNAGDIVLLYSTLVYRELLSPQTSRKEIQLFELFPSADSLKKYLINITHVPFDGKKTYTMSAINYVPSIMQRISSYNACHGYGLMDVSNLPPECTYIVSEGFSVRLSIENGWQSNNNYIMQQVTTDLLPTLIPQFYNTCYYKCGVIVFLSICVMIAIIVICVKIYQKRKAGKAGKAIKIIK
jgi:hypothetical protein